MANILKIESEAAPHKKIPLYWNIFEQDATACYTWHKIVH